MAKIKFTFDTKAITDHIKKCRKEARRVENLKPIAIAGADLIKKRTRLGFGTSGGPKQSLKKLSESYIAQRRGKLAFFTNSKGKVIPYVPEKAPSLHSSTSAGKSNLTASGQMLNSLRGRAPRAGQIVIENTDRRGPDAFGRPAGGLTNSKLIEIHDKGERPFLEFTPSEINNLNRKFRKVLQKCLRRKRR